MADTRYCGPEDLILGKIAREDGAGRLRFVNLGADEMDEALGQVYQLPLTPIPPLSALSASTALTLKRANIFISSGRYLMDAAAGGQTEGVDSYGLYLLGEGQRIIQMILSGALDIGAIKITSQTTGDAPLVVNMDGDSGFDAFYDYTSGWPQVGILVPYQPGVGND